MALFEIHQRFKGHFLNELRVCFKFFLFVQPYFKNWYENLWGGYKITWKIFRAQFSCYEETTLFLLLKEPEDENLWENELP